MVYIVTSNYVCVDSGDYASRVEGVFDSIDKATNLMEQLIKDTRCDFENYDTEEDNYVEGDMSWSIWEKGQYMCHHCDIQITESEIK